MEMKMEMETGVGADGETLAQVLERISSGNAHAKPEGFSRDFSFRKREYWETRPVTTTKQSHAPYRD